MSKNIFKYTNIESLNLKLLLWSENIFCLSGISYGSSVQAHIKHALQKTNLNNKRFHFLIAFFQTFPQ